MDRRLVAESTRGAGSIAARTVNRLLRRGVDVDLSRLEQVDVSLTERLVRIETELRGAQEAQGRQLAALAAEVRALQERLKSA